METWSLTDAEATMGERQKMTPRFQAFMNVPFNKGNNALGKLGWRLDMGKIMSSCLDV